MNIGIMHVFRTLGAITYFACVNNFFSLFFFFFLKNWNFEKVIEMGNNNTNTNTSSSIKRGIVLVVGR